MRYDGTNCVEVTYRSRGVDDLCEYRMSETAVTDWDEVARKRGTTDWGEVGREKRTTVSLGRGLKEGEGMTE